MTHWNNQLKTVKRLLVKDDNCNFPETQFRFRYSQHLISTIKKNENDNLGTIGPKGGNRRGTWKEKHLVILEGNTGEIEG